jgi:1-deoxy-D-xylulose-5-phosphate synthase
VPNLVVMAPSDENELRRMLRTSLAHPGPAAFRFPRGNALGLPLDADPAPLELGRGRVARTGGARPDVLVASVGTTLHPALAAAELLAAEGVQAAVLDARFVKPLDEELLCGLAASARRVVTVEENALAGGFGAACLEAFERRGLLPALRVRRLGLPDAFVTHGDAAKQRAELGLDAAGIARAARELLEVESAPRAAAGPAAGRGLA